MQAVTRSLAEANSAPSRRKTTFVRRLVRLRPVRFLLHYLEMLAVMGIGMLVLGSAILLAASGLGFGRSELDANFPALVIAGMAVSMTAPMVWWMLFRGHSRAAASAMAVAMVGPAVAAIALLASGLVDDIDALLGIEHMAMLPAMAVAVLLHRGEFMRGGRDE